MGVCPQVPTLPGSLTGVSQNKIIARLISSRHLLREWPLLLAEYDKASSGDEERQM